jgi:hypothetical protein
MTALMAMLKDFYLQVIIMKEEERLLPFLLKADYTK